MVKSLHVWCKAKEAPLSLRAKRRTTRLKHAETVAVRIQLHSCALDERGELGMSHAKQASRLRCITDLLV